MALDPVCGMTVDPARAAPSVAHNGTTYYFCSKGCAAKFSADPAKYVAGEREPMGAPQVLSIGGLKRSAAAKVPGAVPGTDPGTLPGADPGTMAATEWVCPMDPE